MTQAQLLVIGYGNTLRRDDGVGPKVAETVESLRLPGVRTLVCQQLAPEYAEPISQARAVIFVDAATDARDGVVFREMAIDFAVPILAHITDPRTLMALAGQLFGGRARAWMLAIPAADLGFGEGLSREAKRGCEGAVRMIQTLHRWLQSN